MLQNCNKYEQIAAYVEDDEVRRLDALRGDIPRSKIMSRALIRYIVDLENGKEVLLPAPAVVTNQERQQQFRHLLPTTATPIPEVQSGKGAVQ